MRWDEAVDRILVLDASVAVRWVTNEPGSNEAARLLELPIRWIAPRLLLTEVASTLRRKAVGGEMSATDAMQRLRFFTTDAVPKIAFMADEEIADQALDLALRLGHRVADCLYLAAALQRGAGLATADHRLAQLAAGRDLAVAFVPTR